MSETSCNSMLGSTACTKLVHGNLVPGQQAPVECLIDVEVIVNDYYKNIPNIDHNEQRVSFGTSGHRGTSTNSSFTESHIQAITQAICDWRKDNNITGPLFLGKDSHVLSEPAQTSALEVLAANEVSTIIAQNNGFTPTPVISYSILNYNKNKSSHFADGVVITPSHNPPPDGGFKYNPPSGGPAEPEITSWIEQRANHYIEQKLKGVNRLNINNSKSNNFIMEEDLVMPYVRDLPSVVNLDSIKESKLKLGVDPMGGASLKYWEAIIESYKLNLDIVNKTIDPQFAFMTLDHDLKIRMDCSSPYAMAKLVGLKEKYDVAFGQDTDADRHGIVSKSLGLLNPNHYLAVCIWYLFKHRPNWPKNCGVGKTLVSSSLIDRVANYFQIPIKEVPVGFKWFVQDLLDGKLGFVGEESAGASFLRFNGDVWTTDKDGIILSLLAAEMTAVMGKDPGEIYLDIVKDFSVPYYIRLDIPATSTDRQRLKSIKASDISVKTLGTEPIRSILTNAPGNNAAIGGLKVIADNCWFALRPSGTENITKIYAESFISKEHLNQVVEEVKQITSSILA